MTAPATARQPRPRRAAAATSTQASPTQAASLRARAAIPMRSPSADQAPSSSRSGGRRTSRTMRRHANRAGRRERVRGVQVSRGQDERERRPRPPDRRPGPACVTARPSSDRSSATSAAIRQATTGTSAPRIAATGSVVAYAVEPAASIGTRPRTLGSGCQISNAGRGKKKPKRAADRVASRRGVGPDGVRHDPPPLGEIAGDAPVVGRVLGDREGDLATGPQPDGQRHEEDEARAEPGLAARRPPGAPGAVAVERGPLGHRAARSRPARRSAGRRRPGRRGRRRRPRPAGASALRPAPGPGRDRRRRPRRGARSPLMIGATAGTASARWRISQRTS